MVLQDVTAAVVKLSTRCDALEAANKNEELFAMLKRIESEVAKISAIHSTCSRHHIVPTQSSPTVEVCNLERTPIVSSVPVPRVSPAERNSRRKDCDEDAAVEATRVVQATIRRGRGRPRKGTGKTAPITNTLVSRVTQTSLLKCNLMAFVIGNQPHQGGLPWHEAKVVYGIANIDNNHWIMVEISFELQRLVVYNSIYETINWKKLPEGLLNDSKFVP